MVKKTKGKHRLDKFYHLAKEQGYRSRAAFKLIQLNRKYDFLSGARTLLDLCAAPGGWCQVAVKNMPVGSLILGVDLAPIKPIRGVKTFVGDITTQKCRMQIRKEANGALMDVVLHDGAPNVGGAWASEAYSQVWLVLEALRLATDVLSPNGIFVTKVFRSKDYSALLYALNQLFNKVEATKPAASRNASAEIFVVCRGYKAPSKIDPRLLDPKFLFNDVQEMPQNAGPDALLKAKVKQRRFREGYEEGLSTTHKPASAALFVTSINPVEELGKYTTLTLDGPAAGDPAVAAFIREHPSTTDEIRILCGDLQVLGRTEFKQLLKWRLLVKRDLDKQGDPSDKEKAAAAADAEGSDDEPEDPEERLLREMSEIQDRLERRAKRDKKRRREIKVKSRMRAAQLAQADGIGEETGPDSLFSLRSVKGGRVGAVAEADAPSDSDFGGESSDDGESDRGSDSDIDSDEERLRYDATMDEYLEESYRSWKERQRMRDTGGITKKKRRRLGMDGELSGEEDDEGQGDGSDSEDGSDQDKEDSDDEGDLIVSLEEQGKPSKVAKEAALANQWFNQDVFADAELNDAEEEEEEDVHKQRQAKAKAAQKPKSAPAAVEEEADYSDVGSEDEEEEEEEEEPAPKRRATTIEGAVNGGTGHRASAKESNGFEVVPLSDSDSGSDSDSEDEFEGLDDNAKAEVLALARKFLKRKEKMDVMDAAYNRYAFHDTGLPKWFMDSERKFMRPAPQITAEEYKAAKDELKAIDARPIKKVAEAKARKRKRLAAKLTQARQKAEAIASQDHVPTNAKMREIEKLYAQARSSGKGKGKKGGGGRNEDRKKKGPPLDARLRSDKRGMDKAARLAKKRGKGKQGGKGGKK